MENYVLSGWREEGVLDGCQTGLINSDSDANFLPPWVPPPTPRDEFGSFHGHQFHASASCPLWSEKLFADEGGGVHEEEKAASASNNHSQAEKRRRDRINAHLSTLRKLISNSHKMDKAALLGKVVEDIKELKTNSMELSKVVTIPTDIDEVIVDSNFHHEGSSSSSSSVGMSSNGVLMIKASVCCDDRPELISELKHALESLRLTIVQGDMTCLGGRIKVILLLCTEDSTTKLDGNGMNALKQSLMVVLSRVVSSSSAVSSNFRIKSRRQRFFFPSQHHHH